MEVPTSLQPKTLLRLSYPALASHLNDLIEQSPEPERVNILNSLISRLVTTESIPPTVYAVWLPIALRYSPGLLAVALSFPTSYGIRDAGIRSLSRAFHNRPEISQCMDDLFLLLESHLMRPLVLYAVRLLPLCSSEMVTRHLTGLPETWIPIPVIRLLVPCHATLLRQIAVGSVMVPPYVRRSVVKETARGLVCSLESYASLYSNAALSDLHDPRIAFCLDLFHVLGTDPDLRDVRVEISTYVDSFLRLRNVPFDLVLQVAEAALPLAMEFSKPSQELKTRKRPDTNTTLNPTSRSILTVPLAQELLRYWSVAVCGHASTDARFIAKKRASRRYAHRPRKEHRHALECLLAKILRDYPDDKLNTQRVQNMYREEFSQAVEALCESIAPEVRLPFLKLLCHHTKYLSYDISSPTPSDREQALLPGWPTTVLRLLPAADAAQLFNRSLKIYACAELLPELDIGSTHGFTLVDQYMLKAKWEGEMGVKDFPATQKYIHELKTRAQEEPNELLKLDAARGAIWTAIASTSIELFHSVLHWTGRFARNPTIFAGLMLDAVLMPKREAISLSELSSAVAASHNVLYTEPDSSPKIARTIPQFIGSLVHRRILGSVQLADSLLNPLIPVIIKYERTGIADGQEKIGWPCIDGLLAGMPCPSSLSDEILGFMDRLAQQREEVFRFERQRREPDVLSLEPGWPRGLALQFLFPSPLWASRLLSRPHAAPFVAGRAKEVLFSPQDILMRRAPAEKLPIGRFVDDLVYAVQAYVGCDKKEEMKTRAIKIWQHYQEQLSDHPDSLQNFRIWLTRGDYIPEVKIQRIMQQINPVDKPIATYLEDHLMSDEDVELDPRPGQVYRINVPVTVLLCRMSGARLPFETLTRDTAGVRDKIRNWPFENYGVYSLPRKLSLETREAIILSGLLILETFTKRRILSSSFPKEAWRYPPAYLEGQFVTKMHRNPAKTLQRIPEVLRSFNCSVSPTLMKGVCDSILDSITLRDPTDPISVSLLRCTVRMIQILSHSDKPFLAVDLVLRTMKELPQETSLCKSLNLFEIGNRLPPDQAVRMAEEGVALVKDRLHNIERGPDTNGPGSIQSNTTISIINTSKQVARTIGESSFLSVKMTLEMLETLFMGTTNSDIRVQALFSIFAQLEQGIAPDSVYVTLKRLSKSASGPSETQQVTEEEWIAAEKGDGPLPSVTAARWRRMLRTILLHAYDYVPDSHMEKYLQDIVLPLLDESTVQHSRWMKAFISRLDIQEKIDIADFPFGPFDPQMINAVLFKWQRYLPASYLLRQRTASFSHLHHKTMDAIGTALSKRDVEFRNTSEGEHWLDCFAIYRDPIIFDYLDSMFCNGVNSKVQNGLTLDVIAEEYTARAAAIVRNPTVYSFAERRFVVWPALILNLLWGLSDRLQTEFAEERKETEQHLIKKTMETIWKLMRHRAVLLPFPTRKGTTGNQVSAFVQELLRLVWICAEDSAKHVNPECRRNCALLLGNIEHDGVYECLRVNLTHVWLSEMGITEIRLDDELTTMIARWKRSSTEFIRRIGWILDGQN
ncbi:hypothetical protein BDV59DRAFT_208012 [Aspergillus ambiguus]|uniref:uncharacterized protein n=1 Tax=Aspergillus ambiguus TaxID=176160 RepID=UPI003CCDF5A8